MCNFTPMQIKVEVGYVELVSRLGYFGFFNNMAIFLKHMFYWVRILRHLLAVKLFGIES